MDEERVRTLLHNALVLLESICECGVMGCDLEDEVGITQEEYDEIMGGSQ